MKVEIITPDSKLFVGQASSVTVPSQQGPFTLLEHHAAIVAILEAGTIRLTDENGEERTFAIKGGFCENHDNTLIVCAEP